MISILAGLHLPQLFFIPYVGSWYLVMHALNIDAHYTHAPFGTILQQFFLLF